MLLYADVEPTRGFFACVCVYLLAVQGWSAYQCVGVDYFDAETLKSLKISKKNNCHEILYKQSQSCTTLL